MRNPEKLIRKGLPQGHLKDLAVKCILGAATYLVVIVALALFAKIVKDGAPVLFKAEAPFVDFGFLLDKNETLHVFDDAQGVRHQLPASQYSNYIKSHEGQPIYNEQTFSYSGGGIVGPIVGTILLTVGSMILALFFGVSAAIYLSEYAKQSPFIHAVRLAILNLAGIPSIVFGLFGFAVFVLSAPVPGGEKIKVDESKLKGPEWKDADKPMAGADLFKQYGTPWTEGVVYFDFDKSTIPETEYPKVNSVIKHLKDNAGTLALVEGHCDDRGSDEYNRALGENRALVVRDHLIGLGIEAGRLETVSYGEEKPAVPNATGEAQHAMNRRAQFIVGTPK